MPSACSGSLVSSLELTSWQSGATASKSAPMADAEGNPVGITGCGALDFSPTLKARPTTNVADSPSGLEVDLHIPQTKSQETLATANLKDAVVTLPKGITVNPSSGNGLQACSSAQIGLTSGAGTPRCASTTSSQAAPTRPSWARVEVTTPLLDNPLPGSVYIAAPFDNPFDSFLAIYVVVDDPQSGVLVKLPGEVQADPSSGRLVTTLTENPQLPFEDFKLNFFGGPAGALRTPATCGAYSTTSAADPLVGTGLRTAGDPTRRLRDHPEPGRRLCLRGCPAAQLVEL